MGTKADASERHPVAAGLATRCGSVDSLLHKPWSTAGLCGSKFQGQAKRRVWWVWLLATPRRTQQAEHSCCGCSWLPSRWRGKRLPFSGRVRLLFFC